MSTMQTESDFDRNYEILAVGKSELKNIDKQELLKWKIVLSNLLYEHKKPDCKDDFKDEYLEKVRLYGFLVVIFPKEALLRLNTLSLSRLKLFSSSFMLGGLICLIILYIDIILDAHKFLFYNKRSVGYPDSGIGTFLTEIIKKY